MTKETLKQDLFSAMKQKEELKTSVLRMAISAVTYYEIQKGGAGYTASEEDIQTVLSSEAKKRKDAIAQYQAADRQDLAEKETQELHILESYLPKPMDASEVQLIITQEAQKLGTPTMSDFGKLMSAVMAHVKGKIDGQEVASLVKTYLTKSA